MKLSDAIEIGCKGKRQIKSSYYDGHGGVCALGAAIYALDPENLSQDVLKQFTGDGVIKRVIDWNDHEGLSFAGIILLLKAEGK